MDAILVLICVVCSGPSRRIQRVNLVYIKNTYWGNDSKLSAQWANSLEYINGWFKRLSYAQKLSCKTEYRNRERCGAVVKHRTRDREVPGSIPTNSKCCFLEQETLSTLFSTGFYPGKKRTTKKISTRLLNVLPSINKVDYYYYYYNSKYWDRQAWANSVDPDQTPLNAASDLDLHCLSSIQIDMSYGGVQILGDI